MRKKSFNKSLQFTTVLTLINLITFSQNVTKSEKNCGCDYFPMCDYTFKKSFGQDVYYGIKGSEKNGTFYNCKNGTITVKWFSQEEYLAERLWEWRNDINDYGYVDYYDTDTKINTKTLYKFNLPVGGEWKTPTGEGGFANNYKIEAKGLKISVNGKQYNDVLKLSVVTKTNKTEAAYINEQDSYSFATKRYIYLNTFYDKGEVFKNSYVYYFDKNSGLIKQESTWEDLKQKHLSRIDGITSPEEGPQWQAFYKLSPVERKAIQKQVESIKQNQLDEQNKISEQMKEEKVQQFLANEKAKAGFTGKPDATLTGSWRYFNRFVETYLIYVLNGDGSFQYYVDWQKPAGLKKDGKWKIDRDSLVLLYGIGGKMYLEKYAIQKINNAYNGKPSLLISHGKIRLNLK